MTMRDVVPGDILIGVRRAMLALNRGDVRYGDCGGLAVAMRGHPRVTKDVDIVVHRDDVARADAALAADGWFTTGAAITFPDGIAMHRRLCAVLGKAVVLDLLVPPDSLDLLSDRVLGEFNGASGWVVSKRALIVMKRLAGRAQDLADMEKLDGRSS